MKICALIPSRNHHRALGDLVAHLQRVGLPVFIIDDGSDAPTRDIIANLSSENVTVYRFEKSQGKGGAVMQGFLLARAQGFTHAVQIDADGQHDIGALAQMLSLAHRYPQALISAKPIYDRSMPLGRRMGRWVTHVWVWIETLSFRISDSMCGFRIYPLKSVSELMDEEQIGTHMDFDTEIMVRLFWRGVAPIMLPVKVIYPPGNTSNFEMGLDNWRITKMHTRLCLTGLARLSEILAHRPPTFVEQSTHWPELRERGAYWGLRFCAGAYRWLGRGGCAAVMLPIILYFYLIGGTQRKASRHFLARALNYQPTFLDGLRHYMNFALRALDVLRAWVGDMPKGEIIVSDPDKLAALSNDPSGALLIVAHLGNVDVTAAMLDEKTRKRLTILVHTRHAENYHRLLRDSNPSAQMNFLQVTEMGPAVIIDLKQRIERGEWIVIAGDRTSVLARDRSIAVPFFGADAPFPQGPWVLAALLECPVRLLFCLRERGRYVMTMEAFAAHIALPRFERARHLKDYIEAYALRLQAYCLRAPYQWYNFYDFWTPRS